MARDYIKIPAICLDSIRMLSDAERGRLMLAAVTYLSESRELILDGAERLVFATLKAQMDRDMETGAKRAEGGRSGGLAKSSKPKQTVANDSNPRSPSSPPTPPVTPSLPPKEKPPKGGKEKRVFTPPTVDEVAAYCLERKNRIDPAHFVDFYTANGWKQGRGKPIVDWRAAVRTWEKREEKGPKSEYDDAV